MRKIILFALSSVLCLTAVRGQEIVKANPPRIKSTAELPRLPEGRWYSQIVDRARGVILHRETFMMIQPNGESSSHFLVTREQPLPEGYQPGDLEAALPKVETSHWYTYSETETERRVWDTYYAFDSYGFRHTRTRFLLEEGIKKKAAEPAPIAVTPVEKKKGKPVKRPSKLVPPSELGMAPLVGESKGDLAADKLTLPETKIAEVTKKKTGPESLLIEVPEMATTIDWNKDLPEFSNRDRNAIIKLLRTTESDCSRWQFDLSKQFLTCTDGKCLVRDRGKGNVEVPFQVGLGRVWVLSLEAERLAYALEEGDLSAKEEREQILQVVRRLESLEALLEYSHGNSKSNYVEKIEESLAALKKGSRKWNSFSNQQEKATALRWQVLARDIQAFTERSAKLAPSVPKNLKQTVEATSLQLKDFMASAGSKPWQASHEAQYELARQLYFDTTAPLREVYRDLARHADTLRDTPEDYINLLVLLGTAENLAVYGWTIMEELAEGDDK